MITIAHRGNLFGKTKDENQLLYLMKAVNAGFGIETDIRRAPCGQLIISHDSVEWTPINDAQLVLKNLILNDAFIALNIKEEGILEDLLKIVKPREMRGFVFDFELCCEAPIAEMWRYSDAGFKLAERVSDRGERPSHYFGVDGSEYLWLDEMDETGDLDLSDYDLDKIIYVSPELHGRPVEERRTEKFHGICTDFCMTF